MKKRILCCMVFAGLCMSVSAWAAEETPLDIVLTIDKTDCKVNGTEKQLRTPPYISKEEYTMLPIREVAEIFPKTHVEWDNDSKTAKITYGTTAPAIYIQKNQDLMEQNHQMYFLETAAAEKNGRMFLSLRDMCHICRIPMEDVLWDKETKTITIHTMPTSTKSVKEDVPAHPTNTFTPVKEEIPYFRHGDDSGIIAYLQKNVDPNFSPEKFEKTEVGQYGDRILSYSYKVGGVPSDFMYTIDIVDNKMVGWRKAGTPLYDYVLPKDYSVEEKKKVWLDRLHKKKTNICTDRLEETVDVRFHSTEKSFQYVIRIVCQEKESGSVSVVPIICPPEFPSAT